MNRLTRVLPVKAGCRLLAAAAALLLGSATTIVRADGPAGILQENMLLDGPAFSPFEPITDPRGPWHEIRPEFCTPWEVIDWVDNSSGVLDFCDYILMDSPFQPEPTWWHIEDVRLAAHFDGVDGPFPPPAYAEWLGPVPADPRDFDPRGPWHMIYPPEIYCQEWFCFDWEDNGNGVLDFCDLLFFDGDMGIVVMHVAEVVSEIDVLPEDPPPPENMLLENNDFSPYDPITDPTGPWHELYPEFCTQWEAIDWVDNSNGFLDFCDYLLLETPAQPEPTWWHVEDVRLTAHFDDVDGPFPPPAYAEWLGPVPNDPQDFDPRGPWHMIYPPEIYCQEWVCFDWEDNGNGVLDFCDLLFFEGDMGIVVMHVAEVVSEIEVRPEDPPPPPTMVLEGVDFQPFDPITDPRGLWHELWPEYCTQWEATEWVDNGNGFLDFCDYLLLQQPDGTEREWWHVQNATLTAFFDEVQGPFPPPAHAEWLGPVPVDPQDFDPRGPWHMIFPPEIHCQEWVCFDWQDNGNGVVDFCDWLFFDTPMGVVPMHVAGIAPEIEVVQEDPPPPPVMVLEGEDFQPFEPITNPVGRWHELWPEYCTSWNAIDWIDNRSGVLDCCDYLLLETPGSNEPEWWHVVNVTLTAVFDEVQGPFPPPAYAEWLGPVPFDAGDFDPRGPWHMLYPPAVYCQIWGCIEWQDNGNGVVDFCDWLIFEGPMGVVPMHVARLVPEITVERESPSDCPADLDDDGAVTFADLIKVLADWNCQGANCPGDASRDCTTDFRDILAVLAAWGQCPES